MTNKLSFTAYAIESFGVLCMIAIAAILLFSGQISFLEKISSYCNPVCESCPSLVSEGGLPNWDAYLEFEFDDSLCGGSSQNFFSCSGWPGRTPACTFGATGATATCNFPSDVKWMHTPSGYFWYNVTETPDGLANEGDISEVCSKSLTVERSFFAKFKFEQGAMPEALHVTNKDLGCPFVGCDPQFCVANYDKDTCKSSYLFFRLPLLAVGLVWLAFTLVAMRNVKERKGRKEVSGVGGYISASLGAFVEPIRSPKQFAEMWKYLFAVFFLTTSVEALTIPAFEFEFAIVAYSSFIFVPLGALFYGWLIRRVGGDDPHGMAKKFLFGFAVLTIVLSLAYLTRRRALHRIVTYVGAFHVGAFHALTRAMYAKMCPRNHEAQFMSYFELIYFCGSLLGFTIGVRASGFFNNVGPGLIIAIAVSSIIGMIFLYFSKLEMAARHD